jgi:hypothetical protein
MLLGGTGSGKTTALCTAADLGLNVRILFTEPGMETVGQYFKDRGKPIPDNIQWAYVAPAAPDWAKMIDSATKINSMSFKALADLSDINKREFDEFIRILTLLANFKSDRNGQTYGAADSWGTDTLLALDSMSGLAMASMNLVTGSKPVKSMADWGVAIDNLERLITKLTTGLRCHFAMTAHLERETDEITGGTQLMASTLGKKLAPKLPRFFSDVVHCKRDGTKWVWATDTTNVDLKARNLPIKDGMQPTFAAILESWKANGGVIES